MHKEQPLRRAHALASRQHGALTRHQALKSGVSPKMITGQISEGLWAILYPAVYVVGRSTVSWHTRLSGAVIGAGGSAVASHRSAARLHSLAGSDAHVVELTNDRVRSWKGVVVHRSPLTTSDVTSVDNIRTTSPSRTLLDLGAVVDLLRLEAALDDALVRGLTSTGYLHRTLERIGGRGRRGTGPLRRLLGVRLEGQAPTESELERLFNRNVTVRHRLPRPIFQFKGAASGARIDFAYPHLLLGVEVLGWRFHQGRRAWERDLNRHNVLVNAGWTILYFTWTDITKRSRDVAASIRATIKTRELVLCPNDTL